MTLSPKVEREWGQQQGWEMGLMLLSHQVGRGTSSRSSICVCRALSIDSWLLCAKGKVLSLGVACISFCLLIFLCCLRCCHGSTTSLVFLSLYCFYRVGFPSPPTPS